MGEIMKPSSDKQFDPRLASYGAGKYETGRGAAKGKEFGFIDRVRTGTYRTRDFQSKEAYMGDIVFQTKEANTKKSQFADRAANTRDYSGSRAFADGGKVAATRAAETRPYLGQEAQKMATGINPEDQDKVGWRGDDLRAMSIEDIKKLLNKN